MLLRSLALLVALLAALADAGAQVGVPRETVAEIQTMLGELGYQPGPADGVMGERTRQAIRRYQGSAGLAVDGEPSMRLRDALRVATGRNPAAPAAGGRRAAWTGSTASSLTLYARPAASSATARVVPAGTEVDVFRRQGEWLEIRTRDAGALEGWVSYAGVRRVEQPAGGASRAPGQAAAGTPQAPKSGGFFSNLARGVTRLLGGAGPETGQQGTVTVGVRGLAAEDLAAASPDPAELEKMESYRASRDQAYQFASRARLGAQTVDYLPEAPSPIGSQPPGSGGGRN